MSDEIMVFVVYWIGRDAAEFDVETFATVELAQLQYAQWRDRPGTKRVGYRRQKVSL